MKTCSRCREQKEDSEFTKCGYYCSSCRREYDKKYRSENKDKLREYDKKRYSENKENKREYNKKRYSENKEKLIEYYKKYYSENKDKVREYKKKYYSENNKNLTDHYIKMVLADRSTLSAKDIPQELIELKRVELMLNRELKK